MICAELLRAREREIDIVKWHQGKTQISESESKLISRQNTYLQLHPDAFSRDVAQLSRCIYMGPLQTAYFFAAY